MQQGSETSSVLREEQRSLMAAADSKRGRRENPQCNVQCYGRGDIHEEVVKRLHISRCEEPRVPCVLFVYRVSLEIEDFQSALQWVTESGKVKHMEREMRSVPSVDGDPGSKVLDTEMGPENSSTSQCNVQCYGRGDIHEEVVKRLHISRCEEPRIPCVLFVYKVSLEIEDFQNALQWVTETQSVKREDICAVVLLEKSLDKLHKPVEVAYQGMFDTNTVVV
ncbi:uncharacterized protein LOC127587266 [Pristis pectinata]|uniref:uncharacterized protein LOC127587266 n=1 Tax=Pristis pectinata TaxID=685728 RepID=UPI00223D6B8A|nr:uncharacterized protein LOC127587266 [Pristis pectinata]